MKFKKTKNAKNDFFLPKKRRPIVFVKMEHPFENYEISNEGHIRQIKNGFILQLAKHHGKLCFQLWGSNNTHKRIYFNDVGDIVKLYFNDC